MDASRDPRRLIPSVDQLLQHPALLALAATHGRERVARHLRALLDELRDLAAGAAAGALGARLDGLPTELARRLERETAPTLVRVINATGVVVHTNLGRAPLPRAAAERVAALATGYSNLELDLASGGRGQRETHAEGRLKRLLGAEAAVVVNNNAAAVLLAVDSLARGAEVIVSRGELVEIGGSFRIPDVLMRGGARLREVGTTNRTRLGDYRAALGPETGAILKVHPSNFRVVGFTEAVDPAELARLAREAGVPLVEDLGSGYLTRVPGPLAGEPDAGASLRAGVDLVTFSGDKLLGGPQAGLIVGRRDLCARLRSNPLYRALRVGKLTLAALDAVLAEHEAGRALESVPVLRMLAAGVDVIRARAQALAGALRDACARRAVQIEVAVVDGSSAVGGGAAPTLAIPTALVAVSHPTLGAERLMAALRDARPAVIARVADGRLLVDLRTVSEDEEPALRDALNGVLCDPSAGA